MHVEFSADHSFLPDLIRANGTVFDLGVNGGRFSELVAKRGARVIGFEPDPVWLASCKYLTGVRIVQKAVARESGKVKLNLSQKKCSSLHFADDDGTQIEVEAISFAEALQLAPSGRIDLVKMDIEGEELPILEAVNAADLARIVQLTVEFHDFLDRASVPRIKAIIQRLKGMGFYGFRFSWRSYGDILFINSRVLPLSRATRMWMSVRYKYFRGIFRFLRRRLRHGRDR